MDLFQKKYIPNSLNDIKFSSKSIDFLKSIVFNDNVPNLLLSGMKSFDLILIVRAFLKDLIGKSEFNCKKITLSHNGSDMLVNSSNYHYEFDMNYYKFSRRDLILKFINAVSKTVNVTTRSYNIIVIKDAHLITHKVQAALRRTMETCSKSTRFIFLSEIKNSIVEAVQSRCSSVNIIKPDVTELSKILKYIANKETIKIDKTDLAKICYHSKSSWVNALDILQLYKHNPKSLKLYTKYCPYRELYFYIKKGDPKYIDTIEDRLYNLLMIDISTNEIIKSILNKIISDKSLDIKTKVKATNIAANSDYKSIFGNKSIIFLNSYCVQLIKLFIK